MPENVWTLADIGDVVVDLQKSLLIATDETTKFWGLVQTPPGFKTMRSCGWIKAVEAVTHHQFDVVVVTYPFADKPFQLFVHAVRSKSSPSQHAGLVVLTTADQKAEAAAFIGKGVNRVVSIDRSEELHDAINEVVDVSPRGTARLFVHLHLALGDRNCTIRTFTENISSTGMLLGTANQLEIGTELDFEFNVPGTEHSVSGRAEVVRHASDKDGSSGGIGLRFITLSELSPDHLQTLLGSILPEDDSSS